VVADEPAPFEGGPEALRVALRRVGYIADLELSTTLDLAQALGKPLLVEGQPGVGKTELARALSDVLGTEVIRLQCYEGLEAIHALYEWNYARQLLHIRVAESKGEQRAMLDDDLFTEEYLIPRPVLRAITAGGPKPPILLIDEIDRADDAFEAFLLEVLADFQITIPELGTIVAERKPVVLLTSNRTRDIHDALRRRCLYLWIDYPSLERELEIVRLKVPGLPASVAEPLCRFVSHMRTLGLRKPPGISEAIEWAAAQAYLGVDALDVASVEQTLGVVVKSREDAERLDRPAIAELLERA
jgi:MoxR-like ATPase